MTVNAPRLVAAGRSFRAYFRAGLRTAAVYALDCAVGLLTYPVELALAVLMWSLFLSAGPGAMALRDVAAYYALTLLVGRIGPSRFVSLRLEAETLSGNLAIYLVRPTVPWAAVAGRELAPTAVNLSVLTPLAVAVVGLVTGRLPALGAFLAWMAVAIVVQTLIRLLVGATAFWLIRIVGLVHSVEFVTRLASGGVLPLDFFPAWVQQALDLTPFPLLLYVPVQAMLGRLDPAHATRAAVAALVWVPVLATAFLLLWRRGLRRFVGWGV